MSTSAEDRSPGQVLCSSSGTPQVRGDPGWVRQCREHGPDDPQPRPAAAPPGQLPPHRGGEPVQAQPPDPGQVPRAPVQHHRQRRAPGHRPERAPRRGQHGGPGAVGQVPDLVHRRRRPGRQLAAAAPQVAQPRPDRAGPLRLITAQLARQPRDQHRVLRVRLVPGQVLALPRPVDQQRLHAHQRQPPPGRQLIQDPPPVPGRLARHRHRRKTPPRLPWPPPSPAARPAPRPGR